MIGSSYKKLLSLAAVTLLFGITHAGDSARTVNSLHDYSTGEIQQMACTSTPLETVLYSGEGGLYLDNLTNPASNTYPIWIQGARTYTWPATTNYIMYNNTTGFANGLGGYDHGFVVFNRPVLEKLGRKLDPGQTVRHMTTAEELLYPAYFGVQQMAPIGGIGVSGRFYTDRHGNDYNVTNFLNPLTISGANLYTNKTDHVFYNLNYRDQGHPLHPTLTGNGYDEYQKVLTLISKNVDAYVTPNTPLSDFQTIVSCHNIVVRWCGDGMVDTAHGEQCDNGDDNNRIANPDSNCDSSCHYITPPQKPAGACIITPRTATANYGALANFTYTVNNAISASFSSPFALSPELGGLAIHVDDHNYANSTFTGDTLHTGVLTGTISGIGLDGQSFSCSATLTVGPQPIPQLPNVTITKVADVSSAKVGDIINYTLTYHNIGNAIAGYVTVKDTLPVNTSYVGRKNGTGKQPTGEPTISGRDVVWNIGTLNVDEQGNIIVTVKVTN